MRATGYDDYIRYYQNQAGFGHAHPGIATYRGPVYQRGNGLGSVFSNLWNVITPLFKSAGFRQAAKRAGSALLDTGLKVGTDYAAGDAFGRALKRRLGETSSNLLEDAAYTIREKTEDQEGGGAKRRRRRAKNPVKKRKRKSVKRKIGKGKKKRRKSKKKTVRKKPKTRRRQRNIFD
jgi:hypothetical protein